VSGLLIERGLHRGGELAFLLGDAGNVDQPLGQLHGVAGEVQLRNHPGKPTTTAALGRSGGKRNEEIIQAAKELAARKGTSVSGLVSQKLRELVEADLRYQWAMHHALDAMYNATNRGGRNWTREEINDERWENSEYARRPRGEADE
jgi:hypothetical protein